jgi:hypothetical protein
MASKRPTVRITLSRWSPALIGLGAIALVFMVLTYPPAQAAAQGFLDLFRVRRFSAIAVDPARLEQIKNTNIDFESIISSNVTRVKDPGKPQIVANASAASQAAGFTVKTPGTLPQGAVLGTIEVQGEGIVEATADTARLQTLLDALQINDVKAPAKLNGAKLTIRKPAMVVMNYTTQRDPLSFVQARSPELSLPDGVSLSDLGYIALRIAGLSPSDAKQFAATVDWHTTFIVPVPANAASFREVGIGKNTGILITTGGTDATSVRGPNSARQQSLLLWSDGDMVYALQGGPVGTELIEFAASLK